MELAHLICLDEPLKCSGLECLPAVWYLPRITVFRLEVIAEYRLLALETAVVDSVLLRVFG